MAMRPDAIRAVMCSVFPANFFGWSREVEARGRIVALNASMRGSRAWPAWTTMARWPTARVACAQDSVTRPTASTRISWATE